MISRLSETPGGIDHTGRAQGADTAAVLAEVGVDAGGARAAARGGRRMTVPPLTWLYVPADRPDRVEKALASRAHAVIVDLEDGVARGREGARPRRAAGTARRAARQAGVRSHQRRQSTPTWRRSAQLAIDGVFVPKVERAERRPAPVCGCTRCSRPRSALESAFAIASHPGVQGISLGEGDLRSQTGALEAGLDWARSRVVNAAVAAGLPRPPQSVYPHVRDLDGLARVVPARPRARPPRPRGDPPRPAAGDRAGVSADGGRGRDGARDDRRGSSEVAVGTLADGAFVDPAMLGGARQVVALAERYGTA